MGIYVIADFAGSNIPLHYSSLRCVKANFSLRIAVCNIFGSIINLMEAVLRNDIKRQRGYFAGNRLSVSVIRSRGTEPVTFGTVGRRISQLIVTQILFHFGNIVFQAMISHIFLRYAIAVHIDTAVSTGVG